MSEKAKVRASWAAILVGFGCFIASMVVISISIFTVDQIRSDQLDNFSFVLLGAAATFACGGLLARAL